MYDGKTEDYVETNGQQISCTSESFMRLEKKVFHINKGISRKIELGRNLKLIADKNGFNENIFERENDKNEALKTY